MITLRGDWTALVEEASTISTDVLELAALSESELPGLVDFLDDLPELPFQYLSLHGPSKGLSMPEHELIALLDRVSPRVDSIVMHPDSLIDLDAWSSLGRRLVIENMDRRKSAGQTAESLEEYFEVLPEARLCFDVAHAWAVDASLEEGARILDRFASRLRQVHISSLDEGQHHVPLTAAHESLFGPLLDRCRDVPWILEAPPRSH